MTRLKEKIQDPPIHERRLEFKTYPLEDGNIICEGWLRDERFVTGQGWGGHTIKPGLIHWIGVRLLLGGNPLTILDAEAEMPHVPNEECREARDSVEKVIGLVITTGFSDSVRERIGSVKGCSHMMHLILAMGPAALHGHWTRQSQKPMLVPDPDTQSAKLELQINSCMLWREDGPLIRKVRKAYEQQKVIEEKE
jgi:hypothetical protein